MSRSSRIGEAGTGRSGDREKRRIAAIHIRLIKTTGGPHTSWVISRVTRTCVYASLQCMQQCESSESRNAFQPKKDIPLTDQIRRASRSLCSNIGEAWRKRRYRAAFVSKLSDSETEAEETRVWLEISWRCGYISHAEANGLDHVYDKDTRAACYDG